MTFHAEMLDKVIPVPPLNTRHGNTKYPFGMLKVGGPPFHVTGVKLDAVYAGIRRYRSWHPETNFRARNVGGGNVMVWRVE